MQFRSALAASAWRWSGSSVKAVGRRPKRSRKTSRVSGSRPFRLIHTEVLRAELDNDLPWAALKDLGRRIDVEELVNLADIVSVAADGAAVFDALMAEARSMRNADNVARLSRPARPTNGSWPPTSPCSPASAPCWSTRPPSASSAAYSPTRPVTAQATKREAR